MEKILKISEVQKGIKVFCDQRKWQQFHSPKNISMALSVEASELMEIFQWMESADSYDLSEKDKEKVRHEVADVCVYLLRLCDLLDIDLGQAISEKMKLNDLKYPVEKSMGTCKKYNEL